MERERGGREEGRESEIWREGGRSLNER